MKLSSVPFYIKHPITFIRRLGYFFYEKTHSDEPWLSPKSVRFLEKHLTSQMVLFEWGSGRSTTWFAQKVKKVISIEYSQEWEQKVQERISQRNLNNVDLKYIPLDHPYKAPTQREYPEVPKYVAEIFKEDKESLDVIVVDGHYRLTCVSQCLDYLKVGGFLVIDNSNREKREDWGVPSNWPILHESENVVTRTTVWEKPKN